MLIPVAFSVRDHSLNLARLVITHVHTFKYPVSSTYTHTGMDVGAMEFNYSSLKKGIFFFFVFSSFTLVTIRE